jgi:hypothetical protein
MGGTRGRDYVGDNPPRARDGGPSNRRHASMSSIFYIIGVIVVIVVVLRFLGVY